MHEQNSAASMKNSPTFILPRWLIVCVAVKAKWTLALVSPHQARLGSANCTTFPAGAPPSLLLA
jgi:hypothetical protein